jgi:hypothetical protein
MEWVFRCYLKLSFVLVANIWRADVSLKVEKRGL